MTAPCGNQMKVVSLDLGSLWQTAAVVLNVAQMDASRSRELNRCFVHQMMITEASGATAYLLAEHGNTPYSMISGCVTRYWPRGLRALMKPQQIALS